MSLVKKSTEKGDEVLNVEGILADFFLKRFGMEESESDQESVDGKRKKHKKHKSKKSKSKHKKRSRSSSSERKTKSYTKYSENYSSSEEKDIQRLQKLKKLETNNKAGPQSFPIISSFQRSDSVDSKVTSSSSASNDIPYGPSLETLLGVDVARNEANVKIDNSKIEIDETKSSKLGTVHKNDRKLEVMEKNNDKLEAVKMNDVKSELEAHNSILEAVEPTSTKLKFKTIDIQTKVETDLEAIKGDDKNISEIKTAENTKSLADTHEKNSETLITNAKENFASEKKKESTTTISDGENKISTSKSKAISKRYRSKSRSLSEDEKYSKAQSSKSTKPRSRSRSNSRQRSHNYKHRSVSRSRSRSLSRGRSARSRSRQRRSRSKEYSKRYKAQSNRRTQSRSRRRVRSRSRSISKGRDRSRSRHRKYKSRSRSKDHSRYHSKSYQRRDVSSGTSKKSGNRSRSRSTDKEKSKSHKIDQEKIRQIAEKNVLDMIEKGTMPDGLSLENFKKEQLVSLKSGGKSVQELTDFCAKLSKRENDPQTEDTPVGNESTNTDSGFIHHPFKIRDTSAIKMNIKNAVQIPIKTHAEKVAETARLSSQFPVSSGNQHRQKELEWIPVEPPNKTTVVIADTSKAVVPLSKPSEPVPSKPEVKQTPEPPIIPSTIPLPAPEPVVPPLQPPPLPPPLPPPSFTSVQSFNTVENPPVSVPAVADYTMNYVNSYPTPVSYAYPVATQMNNFLATTTTSYVSQTQSTSVFPTYTSKSRKPIDVATVVSKRFKALTKLQSNPNDPEALRALEQAQANIQDWVESQQVPGLFTGSTGAKPLSVQQLSGPRHWLYRAKKDIFTRAAPVTDGKGMSLLKKMGWNPGEGLGKNKEGSLEPLVLDIKTDKKGLVSEGEGSKKMVTSVVKDLQGKHPVSALMELCSKRKWKPPLYTIVKETGPPHKRLFLFKVEVNNVEYQSVSPVNNKKVAKADAAVICLQALSVFPKTQ